MGLGSEPLIILGIGFIQIESVKSVVKNQGFGGGSAAPGVSWFDCLGSAQTPPAALIFAMSCVVLKPGR
jgi:hypothetical protein